MSIPPLSGILVADLSVTIPGPYCAQVLCRLGATVVHVEPPDGDPHRHLAAASFAALAAGKDSVVADLKTDTGKELVLSILGRADVVIEGWRPGVAARLGVGYSDVSAVNPRVVYCSLSGYGQESGLAQRAGHDINYAAEAGANHLVAPV